MTTDDLPSPYVSKGGQEAPTGNTEIGALTTILPFVRVSPPVQGRPVGGMPDFVKIK